VAQVAASYTGKYLRDVLVPRGVDGDPGRPARGRSETGPARPSRPRRARA